MNFLGFGSPCTVAVDFKNGEGSTPPTANVPAEGGKKVELPLFLGGESVQGEVKIAPKDGKKMEHIGIKIELLGQIELFHEKGNFNNFVSLVRELEPAGDLTAPKTLPFEFAKPEMQYESYTGTNVRLRYVLRVTVQRSSYAITAVVKEFPFWVRIPAPQPEVNSSIKMEVGIEDCLHIEFEYSRSKYHLKDCIVGKIYFLLVCIKIKHMELEIRRREASGAGQAACNDSETIAKYEIMDGAPVRGESVPVRLFLSPYNLTPTYDKVANRFSVKYFLNLVLVDDEDRRYFKQQEITLYRNS